MRNIVITGAAGGIGSAVSRLFAAAGERVFLGYAHSKDAAEQLQNELRAQGREAFALPLDVTDPASVKAAFAAVRELGGADVQINNAGLACDGLFQDVDDITAAEVLEVNLNGAQRCIRAALESMLPKQQGVIVNITSIWGEVGASCEVHYSAAKAGVIGLTKALAKELGPSGIRVNAVSPGVIRTPMLDRYDEATLQELAEQTPLGRLGTPEDVANAVGFLCSPAASFITAQILGVDGAFAR